MTLLQICTALDLNYRAEMHIIGGLIVVYVIYQKYLGVVIVIFKFSFLVLCFSFMKHLLYQYLAAKLYAVDTMRIWIHHHL